MSGGASKQVGNCKHDGYLSSYISRLVCEPRCMKCGKVWRSP